MIPTSVELPIAYHSQQITGTDLWRVGFSWNAIPLIEYLSSLVEVVEIFVVGEGIIFVVRNLDKTGILFRTGCLGATKIEDHTLKAENILVSIRGEKQVLPHQVPDTFN